MNPTSNGAGQSLLRLLLRLPLHCSCLALSCLCGYCSTDLDRKDSISNALMHQYPNFGRV